MRLSDITIKCWSHLNNINWINNLVYINKFGVLNGMLNTYILYISINNLVYQQIWYVEHLYTCKLYKSQYTKLPMNYSSNINVSRLMDVLYIKQIVFHIIKKLFTNTTIELHIKNTFISGECHFMFDNGPNYC
jgi:hypothetical protein